MASNSPKKAPRVKPRTYSTCLLYNTTEAKAKLAGLTLASCNRSLVPQPAAQNRDDEEEIQEVVVPTPEQLTVSDKMSCGYCDAMFAHRPEQKRHYRSDWHRYNLKLRLKGKEKVSEEEFEDISGNISSLSGSDLESEGETDSDYQSKTGSGKKLPGSPRRHITAGNSSTDSETESGYQSEDAAKRLPKVYFRNKEGELLSIYRCVLCHKKSQPSRQEELVTMATQVPDQMNWAIFMAAGGHFAGAIYNKSQMVVHKTFHRYVVRAKRGTAQGSRDSQGNAPKSAGASLRRYNEAALMQEIQELIASWSEHIQNCDRIFLRAPSFNRKIFFSGKSPPFNKDDKRIRLIPLQTRRPTFNEVRKVYESLASIECYGDESDIQDLVPISPFQVFNPETGTLIPKDENQLTPKQRKLLNRKLGTSPLAVEENQASTDTDSNNVAKDFETKLKAALPEHVLDEENVSSSTSTDGETELVETMTTINFMELKEFAFTRKPKRKKKATKKRKDSGKCQVEPETNVMEEEKYHLKNSLYTACKTGDKAALKNLLAILCAPSTNLDQNQNNHNQCQVSQGQVSQVQGQVSQVQGQVSQVQGQVSQVQGQVSLVQGQVSQDQCNQGMGHKDHSKENKSCDNQTSQVIQGHVDPFDNSEGHGVVHFEVQGQIHINCEGQNEGLQICQQGLTTPEFSNVKTVESSWKEKVNQQTDAGNKSLDVIVRRQCKMETSHEECKNVRSDNDNNPDTNKADVTTNQSEIKIQKVVNHETENIPETLDTCEHSTNKVVTNDDMTTELDLEASEACALERLENYKTVNEKSTTDFSENNKLDLKCDKNLETSENAIEDVNNVIRHDTSEKKVLDLTITGSEPSLQRVWPDFSPVVTPGMLSEPFGDNNTTLLHVAAREGHGAIVALLMESGANPASRDKGGLTPYMACKDKATRNEFRKFMGKWPDRYDYEKAQIPAPLTEEMEAEKKKKEAERKKAQRKLKQEQNKVKRELEVKQQAEEREKQRYLNLSDREKRALAAERRLVSQVTSQGAEKPVLSRCFQCGIDMTGKVPFEYFENKFCSSKCLQTHRKSQPQKKS